MCRIFSDNGRGPGHRSAQRELQELTGSKITSLTSFCLPSMCISCFFIVAQLIKKMCPSFFLIKEQSWDQC